MEERREIDKDLADIKTTVAVVKNDLGSFKDVIVKMDKTIDKLSEIAEEVRRVVLLHENRLAQQEAESTANKLAVKEAAERQDKVTAGVEARVKELEKSKNIMVGIVIVVSAVVGFLFNFAKTIFVGG